MANLLDQNNVDYPGTTGNSSVSRTPPRVTLLASSDKTFVSNQQSHQKGSCEADETEKLNHDQTRPFYDNSQPVRNIGTFVTANSNQINFLIAVKPT